MTLAAALACAACGKTKDKPTTAGGEPTGSSSVPPTDLPSPSHALRIDGRVLPTGMTANEDPPTRTSAAKWEQVTEVAGCSIEYLTNAPEVQAFVWEPCEHDASCESARITENLFPAYEPHPDSARMDGDTELVTLNFLSTPRLAFVADFDGRAVGAYRTSTEGCGFGAAVVWNDRFAASVYRTVSTYQQAFGGLMARVDALDDPATFSLPPDVYPAPQAYPLGTSRWVWSWVHYYSTSVLVDDGSDLRKFFETDDEIPEVDESISVGDHFFTRAVRLVAGAARAEIYVSDGVTRPALFWSPDTGFIADIEYAQSHLVWFDRYTTDSEDLVRVWAAPLTVDPAEVEPTIVWEQPFAPVTAAAGYGKVSLAQFSDEYPDDALPVGINVLSLETGEVTKLPYDPESQTLTRAFGLTQEHLWTLVNPSRRLTRFRLE